MLAIIIVEEAAKFPSDRNKLIQHLWVTKCWKLGKYSCLLNQQVFCLAFVLWKLLYMFPKIYV